MLLRLGNSKHKLMSEIESRGWIIENADLNKCYFNLKGSIKIVFVETL